MPLRFALFRSFLRERPLLIILLLAELVFLGGWGWRHDFITYRHDFGETFVAYSQARSIQSHFGHYGMLHVETSPSGAVKVYTHNVNIGTQYFFILRALGVTSLKAETILVFPVFLAGLLLSYGAIRRVSTSPSFALLFLLFMVLDFANVGAFAFNALRAWHYVGLFSCIYGIHLLAFPTAPKQTKLGLALLALGAFVSFGCGYDFFVIAGLVTILQTLFVPKWKSLLRATMLVIACFALPFCLRQFEIIYWLGIKTWSTDFYTTFAIKVPFASRFISIPSIAAIDRIYERAGLIRPPSYPTSDWTGIWGAAKSFTQLSIIPNYGLVGCCLVLAATTISFVALVVGRRTFREIAGFNLVATYFVGAVAGLFIFAPFSLHVYMKHDFPLIAALIHLAEAVCVVGLMRSAASATAYRPLLVYVAAVAALFVFANAGIVQWWDQHYSMELDLRWTRHVTPAQPARADGLPTTIAAVALPLESPPMIKIGHQARVIPPDHAPWILARASHLLVSAPLIDPSETIAGAETMIYAPGDGWCNLDAREPDLTHRDWLIALLARLWDNRNPDQLGSEVSVQPILLPEGATHPGDIVHLKFLAVLPPDRMYQSFWPELMITDSHGIVHHFINLIDSVKRGETGGAASLLYNSRSQTVDVFFRAPPNLTLGDNATLSFRVALHSGPRTLFSAPAAVVYAQAAQRSAVQPILPEPTTSELLAAFSHYRTVEVSTDGVGYAVIQLGQQVGATNDAISGSRATSSY
jgi:hypothetical protein